MSSLSLDEFCEAEAFRLKMFQQWWHLMHQERPAEFPVVLDDSNAGSGAWFEQFASFDETDPDVVAVLTRATKSDQGEGF